ncbi:MAG: hypothetical protein IIB54_03390, partial [Planctomycetes bacterium]|nr:hypothetical protein [Planctomycetota bacterium]
VVVALWLLLSVTKVSMLMGITNKLCLDIASVPFLWILPLLAYLITFIVCFASERTYRRAPYLALFALALLLTVGRPLWLASLGSGDLMIAKSINSTGIRCRECMRTTIDTALSSVGMWMKKKPPGPFFV